MCSIKIAKHPAVRETMIPQSLWEFFFVAKYSKLKYSRRINFLLVLNTSSGNIGQKLGQRRDKNDTTLETWAINDNNNK